MLRELRKRKQQVADKIGHEEYIYKLNGDAFSGQEEIRVRPQGDFDPRRAAGAAGNRPPFAVDDDGDNRRRNNGGNGRPLAPLNPITGAPAAGAGGANPNNNNNNNGAALVPFRDNNGNQASPYGPPAAYASPYGNNNNGGGYAPQPVVMSFAPVMPPMAPISDLPGPLPPVYRPKPPITFHGNGGLGVPQPLYYPGGNDNNNFGGGGWPAAPLPNYGPYGNNNNGGGAGREDGARPSTSPTVLPPLTPNRAGRDGGGGNEYANNNNNGGGGRSPRPSTSGAAGGGGFVVGSSGLSEVEDRHREKMAARQRAIELQQENARQMLEQQQRKQAEREREMRDDREAENRLRREREEVARRGQAEVDRENRERELKMMGPRAAQEVLEQQRRETEARREAEAAARRNKGRQPSQVSPQSEPAEGEKATKTPPNAKEDEAAGSSSDGATPPAQPQALPLDQRSPISFPSGLHPPPPTPPQQQPGMHSTQQYFANIGLGGAGLTPPPPSPYYAPYMMQQRQQHIQLEGDVIHEELRHIALLLEAQQLNSAISHNTPPPPWVMGPQPASAGGAGTYLTTGMPSPLFSHQGHQTGGGAGENYRGVPQPPSPHPSSSSSSNANSAYRSFMSGGAMPPPPMATAVPPLPRSQQQQQPFALNAFYPSPAASPPGGLGGPWQGLFTAPNPNVNNPAGNGFLGSFRGDGADSEELATEPSRFVMPADAPLPSFIPPAPAPTASSSPAPAAAAAATAAMHHAPSTSSSLGELGSPLQAGPLQRPGTGKPASPPPSAPPNAAAAAVVEDAAQKSETSAAARHSQAPAGAQAGASADLELAPGPVSSSASDSPVRGATPHLTATEVMDTVTRVGGSPPASAGARRKRGSAPIEPPVVILTPRGGEQEL